MATAKKKRKKKYFSGSDANKMLPLVRAIVSDIVELGKAIAHREVRLGRLRKDGVSKGLISRPQLEEEESMFEKEVQQLEECIDELSALGVDLKDVRTGLVDFPGWMDGREVCICWKLGEAAVAYWHEIDSGYSGRQPLPAATQN